MLPASRAQRTLSEERPVKYLAKVSTQHSSIRYRQFYTVYVDASDVLSLHAHRVIKLYYGRC